MLTTGIKQMIINDASEITTYNAADETLKIKGAPLFKASEVTRLSIYQPKNSVPGVYTYDITATGDLAANENFVVALSMFTFRNQGEFRGQYVENSDPLVLQCSIGATVTATTVATAIYTAIHAMTDADKLRYRVASAANGTPTEVDITMTEWSVYPDKMDINSDEGDDLNATYTRTIDTPSFEGRGLPKYLREIVQSNNFNNTSAYAIGAPNKINDATRYILLSLDIAFTSNIAAPGLNAASASKVASYEIWIDEDIDIGVAGKDIIGGTYAVPVVDTAAMFYTDAAGTTGILPTSQAVASTGANDIQSAFAAGTTTKIIMPEAYI